MFKPFEAFVGLRYVRAKRRNHFISFASLSSVFGITLGVMAVITVLSVMNGFEKEMTERTLGMVSHATVVEQGGSLSDWRLISQEIESHPDISGVAPFLRAEGMLKFNNRVSPTIVRGILPEEETKVSDIARKMVLGNFNQLHEKSFNIILGSELYRKLGVIPGDKVTLYTPRTITTPAGIIPSFKRFTVTGIFTIGMNEFDGALALINLEDAKKLFRVAGPSGLRIKTTDVMRAPDISRDAVVRVSGRYSVIDWTQRNRNFLRALKTEKIVMFVILSLIVAVAAFNIVSTLVMVVVDKQADIAVLRTLGASPGSIMKIFIIQGTVIGILGTMLGDILGVWLANNIAAIVKKFERLSGVEVLPCDVYYVCDFPSEMHWNDVYIISAVAFLLCLLATIYPAIKAANTNPAEVLRYE